LEVPADLRGSFIERPNRFLSYVLVEGKKVSAHIHDPGRLKELLVPGAELLLRRASGTGRSTYLDVIAARDADRWVPINSALHRPIAERILLDGSISPFGPLRSMRSEVTYGRSRIDHYLVTGSGQEVLVEVKGCSLVKEGTALFPDAPTRRGSRHISELMAALGSGLRAGLLVLVMRCDAVRFRPNAGTDPEFATVLAEAVDAGLEVHPMALDYDGRYITLSGRVPLSL